MYPAHDGRRVHIYAAFLHHLHQISAANSILAVPANTQQDDRNGKAPTLEHEQS